MSQRSRFFDSVTGDRVYTSDAWAQVVAALVKNGVVPGFTNALAVTESSPAAMSVKVDLGAAFVLGYFFEVYSAAETLAIGAADATNPRIDRIVVRRDLGNRTAILAVVAGTPAASPSAPALTTNTAGTYEIAIAQVRVEALATSILNAKITDERTYGSSYPLTAALDGTTGHNHDGTTGNGPALDYSDLSGKPSTFAPSAHTHADSGQGGTVAYSVLTGKPSSFAPSDHAHTATPGDGGLVSYGSITGKPSTFAPSAHASSHASAGSDPVTVTYSQLTGKPSTFEPSAHTHADSGEGGTVAYSVLTGKPSTFAPSAHASSHENGGSDEVTLDWSQITGEPNLAIISDNVAGDSGVTVYVQTSTPTGVDGDVWIKG